MTEKTLRLALIGAGANVFKMHRTGFETTPFEVVALCDTDPAVGEALKDEFDCPFYTDYRELLANVEADVIAVITPSHLHAEQTVAALEAGFDVLVEKPIAIESAEADAMVAAAERTGNLLTVNFQQRTRPEIIKAKELIDSGELGEIQHADMKITWTRTAIYYGMSTWRGTWKGEGGALLMNQAPHDLDLICYLLGMPSRVYAWTRTIFHKIHTEDTVQAMLEWPDGAMGSIHASTAEAGQPQRFEIMGTKGRLEIEPGGLRFARFDEPLNSFLATSEKGFAKPNLEEVPVEIGEEGGDHKGIYLNLYDVLVNGAQPAAPAASAAQSLELANGMNYSSRFNKSVDFPLDRDEYTALLSSLKAEEID